MTVVILAYDQLLFRPLVAWADKFRMENTSSGDAPESWLLDLIRRTRLIHRLLGAGSAGCSPKAARVPFQAAGVQAARVPMPTAASRPRVGDIVWAHGAAGHGLCACMA